MATLYSYAIGADHASLTNVESLTVPLPAPRGSVPVQSQTIDLASGHQRAGGWLTCTWTWGFLTAAQYDQLRTICPTKTTQVNMNTPLETGVYDEFVAIAVWPDAPERLAERTYVNFVLTFRAMVAY